jgi:divalent metal cation (Fe/Co/Zn/Cd) transporter
MAILITLTLLWAGWRLARAAIESLRDVPRSNDDMIFF